MMNMRIPKKDQELLSAYLDGELSKRQRVRLETRLKREPDLSRSLEELQRTRRILQAMPAIKAPRNFTLTAEMVEQPRSVSMVYFNRFRLVSAVASFLLLLVLAGDFIGIPGRVEISDVEPQIVAVQKVDDQEMLTEVPMMEAPLEGAVESGEYLEEDVIPDETLEAGSAAKVAEPEHDGAREGDVEAEYPGETAREEAANLLLGAETIEGNGAPGAEEGPLMMEAYPGPPSPEDLPVDQGVLPLVVEDDQEFGSLPEENLTMEEEIKPEELQDEKLEDGIWSSGRDILALRVIEIALGVIALVAGVLAVYSQKRKT